MVLRKIVATVFATNPRLIALKNTVFVRRRKCPIMIGNEFERYALNRIRTELNETFAKKINTFEHEMDEVVHILLPGPLDMPQFSVKVSQLKKDFRRGRSIVEHAQKEYKNRIRKLTSKTTTTRLGI